MEEDEDMQALMGEHTEGSRRSGQHRVCGCFDKKCAVITLTVVVIIHFLFELVQAILISENVYFDQEFPIIYLLLLLPMVLAIGFFIDFYIKDTPEKRKRVREGFLLAAISSLLIALWIIIYISCIYSYDKVYVREYDRASADAN